MQAIPLLLGVVLSVLRPGHATHARSPLIHILIGIFVRAVFLGFTLPFVMAWWTTRKPSAKRNVWAIVASYLYLAEGLLWFWIRHRIPAAYTHELSIRDGIYLVIIGVAGVVLFSLREAVSASEAAVIKRKPIAGDRTHPLVYRAFTALSIVLQFACMYLCTHWARSQGLLYRGRMPWLVVATVAIVASSVLHECGHALIAWGFHMKLLGFNAGPIQLRKRAGRWKFKFVPAGFINLGGAVSVVPTDAEQPRAHELWAIAAGPISNFIFGSVALYLLLCANWPYYEQTWRLVAYTASFCFIAGITNLLPFMTEDGNYSDGARILQILTNSPLNEYHCTMNSLASMVVTARRYRDQNIDAIQRASNHYPQELRGLILQLCASNCYLDNGRINEARAALASAEAIYNGNSIELPGPLHTPFVFGHAYLNHNAAAARSWWERMEAKKFERDNVDYWLAQSALFWIEGRLKESEEAWRKADARAQKLPQFGEYEFDRFRCALIRKELDHPSAEAIVPIAPVFRVASTPVAPVAPVAAVAPVFRVAPTPAAQVAQLAPAAAEENARFDPLQFLRAAAMENMRN